MTSMTITSTIQPNSPPKYINVELILRSKFGKYFVEIDHDYLTDKFNLTGISQEIHLFSQIYQTLLSDKQINIAQSDSSGDSSEEISFEDLLSLYGLIHARFILTGSGLHKMRKKFINGDFGFCLRYLCRRQNLLPIGLSSGFREECAMVYCPTCEDLYQLEGISFSYLDGSFFGPSFPLFFLLTYPELLSVLPSPSVVAPMNNNNTNSHDISAKYKQQDIYIPRIFGFRLYNTQSQDDELTQQETANYPSQ